MMEAPLPPHATLPIALVPLQKSSPERRITQKEIIAGEERPKFLTIKQVQDASQGKFFLSNWIVGGDSSFCCFHRGICCSLYIRIRIDRFPKLILIICTFSSIRIEIHSRLNGIRRIEIVSTTTTTTTSQNQSIKIAPFSISYHHQSPPLDR